MNRELLARVRTRIAEVGDEGCDMDSWVVDTINGYRSVTLAARGNLCNTTGCIAGHGIAVATGGLKFDTRLNEYFDGNGRRVEPEAEAARLLDLPIGGSSTDLNMPHCAVFYALDWPDKYQDIRSAEGDAKGMLALLDDLLSGALVYNERGFHAGSD